MTATRRRDGDPVHVLADGRIIYWPSGTVGVGKRKFKRTGLSSNTDELEQAMRAEMAAVSRIIGNPQQSLRACAQAAIDALIRADAPAATYRQYASDFKHVPTRIANTSCFQLAVAHWSGIFDSLEACGASEAVIRNVRRTLGYITRYGVEHGYFTAEPFAPAAARQAIVKRVRSRARDRARLRRLQADADFDDGDRDVAITFLMCPDEQAILRYSEAMEELYPGFGRDLIIVSYASGVRICEALALRGRPLAGGSVLRIKAQLDRDYKSPTLRLPKGGKSREALFWSCFTETGERVQSAALARTGTYAGWWFPPDKDGVNWIYRLERLAREARRRSGFMWRHHFLRHAYASTNLAPTAEGGYGLEVASVSAWLGHSNSYVTQSVYVQPRSVISEHARSVTLRHPGGKV